MSPPRECGGRCCTEGDGVVTYLRAEAIVLFPCGLVLDFCEEAVLGDTVWEKFLRGVLKDVLLLLVLAAVLCLTRLDGGGVSEAEVVVGGGE